MGQSSEWTNVSAALLAKKTVKDYRTYGLRTARTPEWFFSQWFPYNYDGTPPVAFRSVVEQYFLDEINKEG